MWDDKNFSQLKELASRRMKKELIPAYDISDKMCNSCSALKTLTPINNNERKYKISVAYDCAQAAGGTEKVKSLIDRDVLVPLVCTAARHNSKIFREKLLNALCDDETLHIEFKDTQEKNFTTIQAQNPNWTRYFYVGPLKKAERIKEKFTKYQESINTSWPCVEQIGDVLRATVVCRGGDDVAHTGGLIVRTWKQLERTFDIREGHGRLKNRFTTAGKGDNPVDMPPDILMNAIMDLVGSMSMPVEIQIHHEDILHIKDERTHLLYEITRAKSIKAICEQNIPVKSIYDFQQELKRKEDKIVELKKEIEKLKFGLPERKQSFFFC